MTRHKRRRRINTVDRVLETLSNVHLDGIELCPVCGNIKAVGLTCLSCEEKVCPICGSEERPCDCHAGDNPNPALEEAT